MGGEADVLSNNIIIIKAAELVFSWRCVIPVFGDETRPSAHNSGEIAATAITTADILPTVFFMISYRRRISMRRHNLTIARAARGALY